MSQSAVTILSSTSSLVQSATVLTKNELWYNYFVLLKLEACNLDTPSPKQPFSFLDRLAINSYLALCQQESDSVACGSAWLTVHSGG